MRRLNTGFGLRLLGTGGVLGALVAPPDPPPVVAPTASGALVDQSYDENTGVLTYPTAGDFTQGNGTLSFSLTSVITGVTINSSTGVVSTDTAVTGVLTTASVVVRATNSAGFAESGYSLTVVEEVVAPAGNVTDGLTLTSEFFAVADTGDMSNLAVATVEFTGVFNNTNFGAMMEGGGNGSGIILYIDGGTLRGQAGNGSGFADDPSRIVTTWAVPTDAVERTVVFSADGVRNEGRLYIDNVLVSTGMAGNLTDISGGNGGGVGKTVGSTATTPTTDGVQPFTGSLVSARIYRDQATF